MNSRECKAFAIKRIVLLDKRVKLFFHDSKGLARDLADFKYPKGLNSRGYRNL